LSPLDRVNFIEDCKEKFPSGGNSVRNAIAAIASAVPQPPEGERVLLVADQFEELFTLVDDKTARQHYINSLLAAARLDGAVPVHLVLALRADFYANCLDHPELSVALNKNLYNLPLMSSPQLLVAIENRLSLAAAHAETGLIDSLLADLGSEPGNLALLEHALAQLWDKYGGFRCTLTSDAYSEIGRLRGALRRHAEEVYDALGGEDERRLAKKIFLELVQLGEGAQDTRRRIKKTSLLTLGDDAEAVQRILGRLTDARLLTTSRAISADGENQADVVEVAHEVLIREWSRLKAWIDESRVYLPIRQRVVLAAKEWVEHDLKPEYLLVRQQLDEASRLPEDYRRDLSDQVNAFLKESLDEEKRRKRARFSQTQTEMATAAWLDLIDMLVDDAERHFGPGQGPLKLQRVKEGVRDTLRDMGLYEIIPESKSLEPVVMDVLVEWCVVLVLTIKNLSSLWSEPVDAKPWRPAEFLTARRDLEPDLFSHWKILFTEFVENSFLWMITHKDETAITIQLAMIAVTEAERDADLGSRRKKKYARDAVFAALDESDSVLRSLPVIDSLVDIAIELAGSMFRKYGRFNRAEHDSEESKGTLATPSGSVVHLLRRVLESWAPRSPSPQKEDGWV
jgi:hypothetical protein